MDQNRTYSSLAELGGEIRRDRENRGINLQAMCSMTCSREAVLTAIESGDLPDFGSPAVMSAIRNYLNVMGRKDLWPHYQALAATPAGTQFNEPEPRDLPKQPFNVPTVDDDATPRHLNQPTDDVYSGRQAFRFDNLGPTMMEPKTFPATQEKAEAAAQKRFAPITQGEPHQRRPKEPASRPQSRSYPASDPAPAPEGLPVTRRARRVPRANSPLLMEEMKENRYRDDRRKKPYGAYFLGVITLIVLVLLAFLVWRATHRIVGTTETPNEITIESPTPAGTTQDLGAVVVTVPENAVTVQPVTEDQGEVTTTPVAPAQDETPVVADATTAGKIAIKIDGGECWVKVSKNGKVIFGKVMKSGDQEIFDLDADLNVTYGAAQFATISMDGKPFEEAGKGVLKTTYKAVR